MALWLVELKNLKIKEFKEIVQGRGLSTGGGGRRGLGLEMREREKERRRDEQIWCCGSGGRSCWCVVVVVMTAMTGRDEEIGEERGLRCG